MRSRVAWLGQTATSANTHLAKTKCHSPALRRRRGLLAQAFGLADEFLLIRSATTSGANMRRVADKLLVSLEVGLQQLLEFTERSGHWTTHPKYGQNHAERDFRAPPCSELSEHPTAAARKEQAATLRLSRNTVRKSTRMSTLLNQTTSPNSRIAVFCRPTKEHPKTTDSSTVTCRARQSDTWSTTSWGCL